MFDRFTRSSRVGRGSIPKAIRQRVFERDDNMCQFCGRHLGPDERTIDHLIPLALGGLDEIVNYVTACPACNAKKAALPLDVFAAQLNISIPELPVHGDPVIDNDALPAAIRAIRKRVHDRIRVGEIRAGGQQAQKRLEKEYRRALWASGAGKQLEAEAPALPGHARAMLPEIDTIADGDDERLLLTELAKSANTRNLIGTVLTRRCGVIARVESLAVSSKDEALRKRLQQALARYRRARSRR